MSNFLSSLLSPVSFRPKRRIGSFDTFLCIEETGEDDLEITQHPVQQGASITDHAFLKPATVSMSVRFTEYDSGAPLDEVYKRLRELQSSRVPFDVVTGKRIYKNMLFKSLSVSTDQGTNSVLAVKLSLQEIIIVSIETVSVPPRAQQAQPARTAATEKAGQKKAQPVSPEVEEQVGELSELAKLKRDFFK